MVPAGTTEAKMGGAAMSNNFPFELGAYARRNDPETSREAAEGSLPGWMTHAMQILPAFLHADLNAYEASVKSGMIERSACPWHRVSDLKRLGLIEPTGEKRAGATDRMQMVYRITNKGRAALTSK
jgi:hypothetical protein